MLTLLVNGKEFKTASTLGTPLVDVLRDEFNLTGTKIGCREGDCGACAVIIGEKNGDGVKYYPLTSCLTPLGNVVGRHVLTIEAINLKDGLNAIQESFVKHEATQCGFCTPGFIVSTLAYALTEDEFTLESLINSVAGNICRCTGYKSIERALIEIVEGFQKMDRSSRVEWLVKNSYLPKSFIESERKFKEQMRDLSYSYRGNIIAGGTDLLVQSEEEIRNESDPCFIWGDPALKIIREEKGRCYIGGATTVAELYSSPLMSKIIPEFKSYLRLISSKLIRNMATVGGNIANGSPIGDLPIIFQALEAVVFLKSESGSREVPLKEFFTGYKKTVRKIDELIEYIYFDLLTENDTFSFEKISKRTHLDMATVNSAMKISRDDKGIIQTASLSVGGLGPTIRHMSETNSFLVGKEINEDVFVQTEKVSQSEITPRSRPEYKRLLVRQQLFLHMKKANSNLSSEVLR